VLYNLDSSMRGFRSSRRLPTPMRPLVVILLYVCAAAAMSPPPTARQTPPAEPFPRSAWTALAHGRVADAEALARAQSAGDPAAVAVLGHIAAHQGKHAEALAMLEPAAARAPTGDAALELGLLLQGLGRMQAASQHLQRLFHQSTAGSGDPDSLFRGARAAHALGRVFDANALFRAASGAGTHPAVETAWGNLFLDTYEYAEAAKSFQQVLKADPEWAPAHLGLARTIAEENPPAAAAAATRALEIDPQLASAQLLLAELDLDNTRYAAARERIDRVLKANPSHTEARAMLAAINYVTDDRAAFDAEVKTVLAINPAYGDLYRIAGELAARNYRFEEAAALSREAIKLDPTNHRAHASLGMQLMRTGEEEEARRSLTKAHDAFPFDRPTFNLLNLLDKIDTFEVIRDGDFVFKLHPDEAAVLREYAIPLAKEAMAALTKKYDFTPTGPILIEIFPVHDDFAVRTLGLPGMIGALGACFGRVVSLDSPKARPPGTFSWQATLWHELAHVITLQMSKQRVPRWLTEGVSVHEETRARPEWGRDMEVPFAAALERGEVLKLRDLNSGFTRPDTIALAYFQAALLVDHIVESKGEAALRALLRSYGEGLDQDAALSKGLGVTVDQLQATFDTALEARFAGLRAALRDSLAPRGRGDGPAVVRAEASLTDLRAAAAAKPGSYGAQLELGQALAAAGDKGAFEPLERAAALVPVATGDDSPHAIMARLAEQLGDDARAAKEYLALLAHDHTAIDPARRLATLAEKLKDQAAAIVAYERIASLDPFDAQAHTGLGRLALQRQDAATAEREFRAALASGPADKAAAHVDLGETYLLRNRLPEAKKEALAALEIAPTFERAQELLLKAIRPPSEGGAR
jgi:tetratricopeptide (TPR) repeat protein